MDESYALFPSLCLFVSLHPAISSPLSHPILFHLHLLFSRLFAHKIPKEHRADLFELVWTLLREFGFEWLNESLDGKQVEIPDLEKSLTNEKLAILITKLSSVEVRVELDYFYKDVVNTYEQVKDKNRENRKDNSRLLFVSEKKAEVRRRVACRSSRL